MHVVECTVVVYSPSYREHTRIVSGPMLSRCSKLPSGLIRVNKPVSTPSPYTFSWITLSTRALAQREKKGGKDRAVGRNGRREVG